MNTQKGYTVKYRSEYFSYCQMKSRCTNPKHDQYKNYGGRGITVCKRWLKSFVNFVDDMGPKPGKGYSIERNKNNGHYKLSNCRWATDAEQRKNTRRSVYLIYNGERLIMTEWAIKLGVNIQTLSERKKRGYTDTQVIERKTTEKKHFLKRKYKKHGKIN